MKIAVPHKNGQVVLHLADAKEFKIYDVLDDEILSEEILPVSESQSLAAGQTASAGQSSPADLLIRLLTAQGGHVIICGPLPVSATLALENGGGLLPVSSTIALQKASVQVLGGASGAADDRVKDFLTGTLHFDRGGSCASCAGACSLSHNAGSCGTDQTTQEPECDGNISACGHACY